LSYTAAGVGASEIIRTADFDARASAITNGSVFATNSEIRITVVDNDSETLINEGSTFSIRTDETLASVYDSDGSGNQTLTLSVSNKFALDHDSDIAVLQTASDVAVARLDADSDRLTAVDDRIDNLAASGIDREGVVQVLERSADADEFINDSWLTSNFDSDNVLIDNRNVSLFGASITYTLNDNDSDTTQWSVGSEGSGISRITDSGVPAATLVDVSVPGDAAIISQIVVDEKGRVVRVQAATGIDCGEY